MIAEKINKDYIEAMKARDSVKSSTLNFLRAQLKNIQIEKKVDTLDDLEVISIIKKQVKQRQDSLDSYKQGGRQDLVDKESAEYEILKGYLPEELPDDQLGEIIDQAIATAQASTMKDMGGVMKIVSEQVAGRADNKKISQLVREKLS